MSEERPSGGLWTRSAEVVGVDFPQRTIELVVIPYETEVSVHEFGRRCRETIARGAFDGIERRANRVRVNRDHLAERTIGRAIAFHPSREVGLVSEVRIAKTPLGDETLALADEGCLDASAAFAPMENGLEWLSRNAYRVVKAWLGHIAMTPDPAYEAAQVLAVRHVQEGEGSTTPNLDTVRGWLLEDRVRSDAALTE